jgi:hypothetical protein
LMDRLFTPTKRHHSFLSLWAPHESFWGLSFASFCQQEPTAEPYSGRLRSTWYWIADSGLSTATCCHSLTGRADPPPLAPSWPINEL